VRSLAWALRNELMQVYPNYDWHNKTQDYKDNTVVAEAGGRTVRDVMIQYGQDRCLEDPLYWAKRLIENIKANPAPVIAVDDLRKGVELSYFKGAFPGQVTHEHLVTPTAIPEPEFENELLRKYADYHLSWARK
jgi:hypothetical protein